MKRFDSAVAKIEAARVARPSDDIVCHKTASGTHSPMV